MSHPIKISLRSEIVPILAIVAAFALGVYFYQNFPETVVTHWNFEGQPDGYSSRAVGAFAIPALIAGIYLLFLALPFLDPKRERYQAFEKTYHLFKAIMVLTFLGIFLVAGAYNLGYNIAINQIVPLLVGALIIIIGNFMGKIKNNWFIGIRTPWTLSSENTWNKTHRLGGYLFVLFGIGLILAPYLGYDIGLALLIGGAAAIILGTVVYSYFVYRSEQKNG